MAIRIEELNTATPTASIYRFPTGRVRARARRQALGRRVGVVATIVLLTCAFVLAAGPRGTAIASRASAPPVVVVGAGDTPWELAARYAGPGVDPRAYVDALFELNGLNGALVAGQRVELPR